MNTDPNESFRNLVASGSAALKERWESVVQRVSAIAAENYGIILDREVIVSLPEAKIATLSDAAIDSEQVARELQALPQIVKAKAERDLQKALAAGEESAVASLPKDRASRISKARRLGLGDGKTPAPKTAESEAVLLRRALSMSPASRISFLRSHGLC